MAERRKSCKSSGAPGLAAPCANLERTMSAARDLEEGGGRQGAPLVAIVTPVYNGAEFLRAAMESVQAQTYPNLIHVVLDNASTDGTAEIIAAFANGRVPLKTHTNAEALPLAANWNAAMALAPEEAKYVSLICADDTIDPDFAERMVEIAESDPEIELVGSMHRANDKVVVTMLPKDQSVFDGRQVARDYLNRKTNELPHMWGLFRRRAEDFRGPFYNSDIFHFDTIACLRALARGKFGFVHMPIYMYRKHEASISLAVVKGSSIRTLEWMRVIELCAPDFMSGPALEACKARQKRFIYRAMLRAWFAGREDLMSAYREFLQARGVHPKIWDFIAAALAWPVLSAEWRLRALRARLGA